jgi:hypothetical protein
MPDKRDCKYIYPFRTSNVYEGKVKLSKRTIFCCSKKHGYRIKEWKCVGPEHPECEGFMINPKEGK